MLYRIILVLISSLFVDTVTAQSDSTRVNWSIDFEVGYGTILGFNGKPRPIICFEGCSPVSSNGDFKSKRIGVLLDWDKNTIGISGGIVNVEVQQLYRDDFLGGRWSIDWDIQYLVAELSYMRTVLSKTKWLGRAEMGVSYYFNPDQSDGLNATSKNTLNLTIGGRADYYLNSNLAVFARIALAHSLQNNLDYFVDSSSSKNDRFAPLYGALGLRFDL